jgi:hypothetical protein
MGQMTTKKTKKKPKKQSPFDLGLDTQQDFAEALCDRLLKDDVSDEDIDEAFIGAFHGFAHRMLTIFNKEFVLEIVSEMSQIVEEDEDKPHVCSDCEEKDRPVIEVSDEDRKKMH